ncbi:MAG: putative toxin-antitoxin system toxin component, PIN family [Planctomycetaceae bacterium]|jgi:putative PIN family toxin of toxin-antitoxin system|nr:putative toxin-antitoxin system toxin component, PIN family [Planctomycetaceae bacterium]
MKENKKTRIVVDVNIWISTLLTPNFRARTKVFFKSEYLLVVSKGVFDELDEATHKPHIEKRIIRGDYEELVFNLQSVAELIDVHSTVDICRDPKDNFLLVLAKDGNADYLITGDGDLLVLKEFEKTKIVTLSDFEAAYHY